MRYYFFEMIACPVCKGTDLLLHAISEERREVSVSVESVKCRRLCAIHGRPAAEVPLEECAACVHRDVIEGIIVCNSCGRWYRIEEGIPVLLPDGYRSKKEDRNFIVRNVEKIPMSVLEKMKFPSPTVLLGKDIGARGR